MNQTIRPRGLLLLTIICLGLLAACNAAGNPSSPTAAATPPAPTLEPTPDPEPSPVALSSPDFLPSPTDAPLPPDTPSPAPTAPPPATATPTSTPDTAAVGLPCHAEPPLKPDYAAYVLSAEAWPTPDPAAPRPPLSLADPLPFAGRNTGYPYGSDGSGRYLLHNGLDMADEDDDVAVAVADGRVIVARDDLDEVFGWRCDWYGQLVVIQLDETWDGQPVYALYGHVKDVQVSEWQRVERGEPIARGGAAGVAVVPHLHLEIRVGANTFGATRNPLLWLEPWSGSGVIAGRLLDPDGRAWQGVTVTLIDRAGQTPFLNTWTYLDDPEHLIRPDPALGENFVFGPVAAGSYDVYAKIQGVEYRRTVEVVAGELTTVELITEPYRTPTPASP